MTRHATLISTSSGEFQLSPGEIHFLWWFIQGSIMNPDTRVRMRKAWGFCERHAWGWISLEAAFRSGYLHGPAVLYEDVMGLALAAFEMRGRIQYGRLRKRLRPKGPCLMCEEGYDPNSKGIVNPELVKTGRNLSEIRALAQRTLPYWRQAVCGPCAGTASTQRCRRHLMEERSEDSVDSFQAHRALVAYIFDHLTAYALSFRWEFRGTQTEEDVASLIAAVGWLSGWKLFLSIIDEPIAQE